MRPLRIEVQGFGAFRDHTEIDLTDIELVALVGATGSGKSTIIDAVTFALYGSVARYDDNTRVAYIVNQLSTEARVSLTFELNGAEYRAVRVVRRTASGGASTREARLECGESVLADSARPMSGAVRSLLGLDVDQFNRTVVLPQGRFADFLHDDPADRQATLRQLLGLDIYQRIGQAARARAARLDTQLELLRGELADDAAELTEARRGELAGTLSKIETAQAEFALIRERHADLTKRRVEIATAIDQAEHDLGLLATATVPDGIDQLAERDRTAQAELQAATERLADATGRRAVAKRAVDEGPDLTAATLRISLHDQLATTHDQHAELTEQVERLSEASRSAAVAADAIRATQRELDAAVDRARNSEDAARSAVAEAPSSEQLDLWSGLHAAKATADAELAELGAAVDAARAPIADLESANKSALEQLSAADAELAELRERSGVAGHAHLLTTGEPCPLCLQPVAVLPDHQLDEQLDAAAARHTRALQQADAARVALDSGRDTLRTAEATLVSATTIAQRAAAAIEGVAPPAEIEIQRTEATRVADAHQAAIAATAAAVRAATEHRDDPAHLAVVDRANELHSDLQETRGRLASVAARVTELTDGLADGASRDETIALREHAERLLATLETADALVSAAEHEHTSAVAMSQTASAAATGARRDLSIARDQLAALGPPSLDDTDLARAWATLAAWRDECHERRTDELTAARTAAEDVEDATGALVAGARCTATDATGSDAGGLTIDQLGEFYAGRSATARASLAQFDTAVVKLAEARARIEQLEGDEAVARTLGQLLRADAFEAWLMQSALGQLVERATERLFELSGGQYSLIVVDNQFLVRDHSNADETRSTRTLSGGETFLASLSLALALSEATAELAPEGAPQIESIFLDEGFGTLDPDTLDTVATAIEELGASGRMVGIVTHIRELADRMPVRLEVTKSAGTAAVERVDV